VWPVPEPNKLTSQDGGGGWQRPRRLRWSWRGVWGALHAVTSRGKHRVGAQRRRRRATAMSTAAGAVAEKVGIGRWFRQPGSVCFLLRIIDLSREEEVCSYRRGTFNPGWCLPKFSKEYWRVFSCVIWVCAQMRPLILIGNMWI
jgi:hypothetical protein